MARYSTPYSERRYDKYCGGHLGDHHCACHSERTLSLPYKEMSLIWTDFTDGDGSQLHLLTLSIVYTYLPGPCYDTPLACPAFKF